MSHHLLDHLNLFIYQDQLQDIFQVEEVEVDIQMVDFHQHQFPLHQEDSVEEEQVVEIEQHYKGQLVLWQVLQIVEEEVGVEHKIKVQKMVFQEQLKVQEEQVDQELLL